MQPRAKLATVRLRLRPVAPEDEADVVAALNDYGVTGWLSVVPFPYTASDFRLFQQGYAVPGQTYSIHDSLGHAGIIGVEDRTLGYWLAPRAQGRGYASEAARTVLAEHFACAPGDIASGYFDGNSRSANVLRKLGFDEIGRDRKFCRALGRDRPHVTLRLTRAAWEASRPA
ncbi:MAG: GNAT family N-acetyltransferase [Proteobacteria bacterium]|nr:GNAT family N-acetyltransferase [Pseudomonadota bacterium]MBS0573920.1 GNAT family N-acetyltransferase [Pseudomonadota bacterium]